MPKPKRGQVLTGWLKARTRSQSILKEATARHSCSQLRVPLNSEAGAPALHADNLTSTTSALREEASLTAHVGIPCLWTLGRTTTLQLHSGFLQLQLRSTPPRERACLAWRPGQKGGVEQKGVSAASEQPSGWSLSLIKMAAQALLVFGWEVYAR